MYIKSQIALMVEGIVGLLNESVVANRSCLDCKHFDEASAHCKQFNAKPPPRTIVNGCDSFAGEIPF
jgi:hypothetical protein